MKIKKTQKKANTLLHFHYMPYIRFCDNKLLERQSCFVYFVQSKEDIRTRNKRNKDSLISVIRCDMANHYS